MEKQLRVELNTCSPEQLNDALCFFYVGMRTKSGDCYKRNSYLGARAAIGCYACQTLGRAESNIWKNSVFERSHRDLDGVLKQRRERGEEPRIEHKAAISEEDMECLKEYFPNVATECDPVKLSQYCWFFLTLHFALRGAEIQTKF